MLFYYSPPDSSTNMINIGDLLDPQKMAEVSESLEKREAAARSIYYETEIDDTYEPE